jgi:hypothetical protein
MPIIRSSRVLYRWLLSVVFGAFVFKLSVWFGVEGYVSGLRAAAAVFSVLHYESKNQYEYVFGSNMGESGLGVF